MDRHEIPSLDQRLFARSTQRKNSASSTKTRRPTRLKAVAKPLVSAWKIRCRRPPGGGQSWWSFHRGTGTRRVGASPAPVAVTSGFLWGALRIGGSSCVRGGWKRLALPSAFTPFPDKSVADAFQLADSLKIRWLRGAWRVGQGPDMSEIRQIGTLPAQILRRRCSLTSPELISRMSTQARRRRYPWVASAPWGAKSWRQRLMGLLATDAHHRASQASAKVLARQ